MIDESRQWPSPGPRPARPDSGSTGPGCSIFTLWNIFTLIGALAGEGIGDPRTYGLDAAVGAAFLGLLWPRLTSWHARVVALFAAAVALGAVPVSAAGMPIIIGGALGGAARAAVAPQGGVMSSVWIGIVVMIVGCFALKPPACQSPRECSTTRGRSGRPT
ncbi:hypothetical protein [Aeromicrobium sp. UC242_57]|uniref:hypothetical protein n=1 Tax=Aeromicrobium sp. UC242_57 TaxID=3374624 RepID=UPI00379DF925